MNRQSDTLHAQRIDGHWIWLGEGAQTHFCLVGRGPATDLTSILGKLPGSPGRVARLRQVHSSTVIRAIEGICGEADALFTDEPGLAMSVATADCLPIVLSTPSQSAVIHAGWRGLARGIIRRTVEQLNGSADRLSAWIGAGIGRCCYEVGQDVADRVAAASSSEIVISRPSGGIHLDLEKAARIQLSQWGIQEIESLPLCTSCEAERLWSYRREGPRAGRNWTVVWRTPAAAG